MLPLCTTVSDGTNFLFLELCVHYIVDQCLLVAIFFCWSCYCTRKKSTLSIVLTTTRIQKKYSVNVLFLRVCIIFVGNEWLKENKRKNFCTISRKLYFSICMCLCIYGSVGLIRHTIYIDHHNSIVVWHSIWFSWSSSFL